MGEEFYAIIKLVSGEEVFSLIMVDDEQENPIIIMQNPIIIKILHSPQGSFIKVKPWMELSEEDFFMIRLDKVLTMTESTNEKLIEVYNNYISDDEQEIEMNTNGKVKPDSKMGYVSTVEDARKHLETLYKLKDTKES
jgi:hypothetical protein|tara:strand:+ start:426 stop:839 length:414 start_codon:yes stop_codon:yes gene_type:complete